MRVESRLGCRVRREQLQKGFADFVYKLLNQWPESGLDYSICGEVARQPTLHPKPKILIAGGRTVMDAVTVHMLQRPTPNPRPRSRNLRAEPKP